MIKSTLSVPFSLGRVGVAAGLYHQIPTASFSPMESDNWSLESEPRFDAMARRAVLDWLLADTVACYLHKFVVALYASTDQQDTS